MDTSFIRILYHSFKKEGDLPVCIWIYGYSLYNHFVRGYDPYMINPDFEPLEIQVYFLIGIKLGREPGRLLERVNNFDGLNRPDIPV